MSWARASLALAILDLILTIVLLLVINSFYLETASIKQELTIVSDHQLSLETSTSKMEIRIRKLESAFSEDLRNNNIHFPLTLYLLNSPW